MDPLTAIGLAGNIVQFVGFSCKLISETSEVYKSATGLPQHAVDLESTLHDVEKMIDSFQISSKRGTTSAGLLLRSLAFDCTAVATSLRSAIEKLKNDSKNKFSKSFMTALKLVLRPEQVQRIVSGIAELQKKVGLQLLTLMSEQQYEMTVKLGEIEDNDRRLGLNQTIQFQQLKGDLLRAINSLQKEQTLQRSSIEAHLAKISRMQVCTQSDVSLLSQRMDELRSSLKAFESETWDVAVEQALLDSLAYEEAYVRRDQVGVGHSETFGWIFDKHSTAGPTCGQTFAQWLRSDERLCWIAGKPGSGISTLMKRILMEGRTREELLRGPRKLNTSSASEAISFGLPERRYRNLRKAFSVPFFMMSSVRRQNPSGVYAATDDWSHQIPIDHKDINKKYCFFIDGLDEYKVPEEGNHDDLVLLLQLLSACPNFKFVIASREENEFRDHYLTANRYILQQLTVKDIETLVHGLSNENQHFQRLSKEDPAYLQLEQEIVRRAQGVFLWVTLVVRTLLAGMRNSDLLADLHHELDSLPDSLEKYFLRIIESIEPRYRVAAAKSLQLTNQAIEPLHLLTHYFLQDTPEKPKSLKWTPLSASQIDRYREDARRRLSARCRGLLEIVEFEEPMDPPNLYFKYDVVYLHRTIRDFLYETSEMQTLFEKLLPAGYVVQWDLCQAFLRLMSDIPLCACGCDMKTSQDSGTHRGNRRFEGVFRCFAIYARYMWAVRNEPQIELLREAERTVFHRPKQWRQGKPTGFVGLAVRYGLAECVKTRIEESPKLLHEKSRPLLDYAVNSGRFWESPRLAVDEPTFNEPVIYPIELEAERTDNHSFQLHPHVRLEMIDLLLRLGAPVERRTWSPLLLAIHANQISYVARQNLVTMLAKLVEYGANVDEEIVVNVEFKAVRETGRASDLYRKGVRVEETERASTIIENYFDPVEVETILRHRPAETKAKSWWSWMSGWSKSLRTDAQATWRLERR